MTILQLVSILVLVFFSIPFFYLLLLLSASIRSGSLLTTAEHNPKTSFIVIIPAHNEEKVIERTVKQILSIDYPLNLFRIVVAADHCSDSTSSFARQAGALVFEREENPRSGKGAAISWVIHKIDDLSFDAVVIFDADTQVDKDFLRIMDQRIQRGDTAIQGQHIISNPDGGWFPALTWAMFIIDNRIQNMGRSNLGWSAKNMGDSICIRRDILKAFGWGKGLTEDYQLRQQLLLGGIKIVYEPRAKGFGEAAHTWHQARAQRARWLRGTQDASKSFAYRLLHEGITQLNGGKLDGAIQAYLPSYSSLTLFSVFWVLVQIIAYNKSALSMDLIFLWVLTLIILFLYPFCGLFLEKAPAKAYLVILTGPLYIIWRSWLALSSRFNRKQITWVRTAHGDQGR